jgi:hypothetical protein
VDDGAVAGAVVGAKFLTEYLAALLRCSGLSLHAVSPVDDDDNHADPDPDPDPAPVPEPEL